MCVFAVLGLVFSTPSQETGLCDYFVSSGM